VRSVSFTIPLPETLNLAVQEPPVNGSINASVLDFANAADEDRSTAVINTSGPKTPIFFIFESSPSRLQPAI
jgi:hypothetical protein